MQTEAACGSWPFSLGPPGGLDPAFPGYSIYETWAEECKSCILKMVLCCDRVAESEAPGEAKEAWSLPYHKPGRAT